MPRATNQVKSVLQSLLQQLVAPAALAVLTVPALRTNVQANSQAGSCAVAESVICTAKPARQRQQPQWLPQIFVFLHEIPSEMIS